ncbi:MAG: tetratricopeptide repeat protein [Muribaculaceae bacterium]|nr:tetratricopeptide repeat protein [Muribaculaceae bacterium]
MKKLLFAALMSMAAGPAVSGQTLAEAQALVDAGDYKAATPLLEALSAKEPKNGKVSLALGQCYLHQGSDSLATAELTKAKARGQHEAAVGLASLALKEYRVDDADELLETYRKTLKKNRKTPSEAAEEVSSQIDRIRNMLMRVEQIEVFDSINVPAADFFKYYRLSPESGSINSPAILPRIFACGKPTVVYEPESRSEMMWAAPSEDGSLELVRSVALYGDEWDQPVSVGAHLGEGGDANYPFLMSDGITLYYANNGENSLGGYDIFITRSSDSEFLQPQNLGMPYNSPYNDYMLAIDENTGIGWWATDRNQLPDSVTIYLFVPSEVRRNIDVNAPDLRQRALLSSIALTQTKGADYDRLRSALDRITSSASSLARQCTFYMPDGRLITRIEQLSNRDARAALRQYIDLQAGIDADAAELSRLRQAYADGDSNVRIDIISIENRATGDREALKRAANEVIACELGE